MSSQLPISYVFLYISHILVVRSVAFRTSSHPPLKLTGGDQNMVGIYCSLCVFGLNLYSLCVNKASLTPDVFNAVFVEIVFVDSIQAFYVFISLVFENCPVELGNFW